MSSASLVGQRGTTIGDRYPVRVGNAAFDITQAGVSIVFTAKRKRTDAAPLLTKAYHANGGSDPGMNVVQGTTDTLQVDLLPADTAAFTQTEFLVFDLILTEPDGRETPITKGALVVRVGVGS